MQNATVLVVDDNVDIVAVSSAILEHNGYAVLPAYSGSEALTILTEQRPTVIVLDVVMPDINGLEVLKRVRNTPTLARTPVILLTCLTSDEDLLRGYRAGASYYMMKPVTPSQLLQGVRFVHRQSQERRTALYEKKDNTAKNARAKPEQI